MVDNQHGQFGHVLELCIGPGQGDLQVGKSLAHLFGEIRRQFAVDVFCALARGVHKANIGSQSRDVGVAIG